MPLETINFNFNDASIENARFYIAIEAINGENYFNIAIDNNVRSTLHIIFYS